MGSKGYLVILFGLIALSGCSEESEKRATSTRTYKGKIDPTAPKDGSLHAQRLRQRLRDVQTDR